MSGDYVLIYEKKQQFLCSIRNRICRAFLLPITCGHYIAECHLPTFYAHIISVIMCEKYFCARCIAECAILPRHCEYQEKLFGKTPSRFYSKINKSVKFIEFVSMCAVAFRRRRLQLFRYLELVNVSFQSGPPTSIFCRIIREMLLFL